MAHERQARSEISVENTHWSHSILSSHDLQLAANVSYLDPTDSLKKIKRLFAVYCSTYWHTLYKKLQKQIHWSIV